MRTIDVATPAGLRRFNEDGGALGTELQGKSVTAIARDAAERWAIVDRTEIWRSPGGAWEPVAVLEGHEATCLAMTDALHVGSSEARLFRLEDRSLVPVAAFDRADGRETWFTPWGGPPATRSISEWGPDVYVNVHVGGILRTDDAGASWRTTIEIEADVHQVATAEGRVLAATAGGLAVSTDRGTTWTRRAVGLDQRYARSVVVCGDQVLLSASRGPRGGRAAIYRAPLGEGPFERCRAGLPEWFDGNIDTGCLDALNDGAFAVFGTEQGSLFGSDDGGRTWRSLAGGLPTVRGVLIVP